MSHCKYPHMFEPMTVNGVTFKNRVFASPITTNRVVDHGYPTPEGIDVYETKARGGFATVTLTESFIDGDRSNRHEHGLNVWANPMTTFHMESIMVLTEAIKAHGAVASLQLNHVGAMNHPDTISSGRNPIGPSAFVREDGVYVEEMTVEMMEEVANAWAEAAWNCKALGFQMVNLHGGHGWLLNQFISPRFNHRTDEFGGSMENRSRFPIMVCDKIKEVCGKDFLIEYRMSGSERIEGGMTLEDGVEFAKLIQDHVDLIHVTSGVYQDHVNTKAFSSTFDAHGCNLDLAEAIKKNVHVPVVAVGSKPFVPPIKGIEYASHAVEAYKDIESIRGKKIVIIGGGAIGYESGYFFASDCGATVQILEMKDEMCKDSFPSQRMALIPRMEKSGMILDCSVKVQEITPDGVVYLDADGDEQFGKADIVYYCCGNRADEKMVQSLDSDIPWFVVTGDAKRARTVKEATYEGFCAAMDIL